MRGLIFLSLAVILAGCSTVQSRIKERPQVFNSLSAKQKTLVTQGEVTEGITPDAVWLAWGKPDNVVRGSDRGVPIEEWIYEATHSELVSDYRPSPIFYGRHGRYYGGWDYVFEPVVISQPYVYKSIRFENGRAVAWRSSPLR